MPAPIEELEQELYELDALTEGMEEGLAQNRVAHLIPLVSKTGKMTGHVTGMTPAQYEKLIGKRAPANLLVKARGATTAKVPWDMVLDQLASEHGFDDIEALRDSIEQAHKDKKKLEELKDKQRGMRREIIEELKTEPGIETVKEMDVCPQFPENECAAEVTMVDGLTFKLRRQHSYWRVDAGDKSFRIRYAKDARKVAQTVTRNYQRSIVSGRAREI